jgi:hypothetical protein
MRMRPEDGPDARDEVEERRPAAAARAEDEELAVGDLETKSTATIGAPNCLLTRSSDRRHQPTAPAVRPSSTRRWKAIVSSTTAVARTEPA